MQYNAAAKMRTFQDNQVTVFEMVAYKYAILADAFCAINHDCSPCWLYASRY